MLKVIECVYEDGVFKPLRKAYRFRIEIVNS